jgi:protein TonB
MHLMYKRFHMETNKIKDADILDILFDGRNKEYGAYELRKTYNSRMTRALAVTACVVLGAFGFGFVSKHARARMEVPPIVTDVVLEKVEKPITPPVTPPPPVVKAPPVATVRWVTPRVVPDPQATEAPPENKDIDNVKISTATHDGAIDDGRDMAPPSLGSGNGNVVEQPKKEDDDGIFLVTEIDASYPGGVPAWARFLSKNLRYPDEAQAAGIQGPVLVQFIVDKEGNVSDVQAVSGPTEGGLRDEAIRVIKKSGKWVPAIQNGRNVKSYKRQPVIFKIADD